MNIGGFVQMEGFLSSSLQQDISLRYFFEKKPEKYSKNALVEIVVKGENLGGDLDWGFAYIKDSSYYPNEEEVLFNPINIFRVHRCQEN